MGRNKKLTRARIGAILHRHNKERFQHFHEVDEKQEKAKQRREGEDDGDTYTTTRDQENKA